MKGGACEATERNKSGFTENPDDFDISSKEVMNT